MQASTDLRGLVLALVTYVIVFVLKLATYFITGVMVLLAEALHTLSDIFISAFLLIALLWSQRKADDVHMFGYGRAQNVAALVAATLFISFTSYKLFEESIPRLFQTEATEYGHLWLALTVVLISMIIAAAPLAVLLRQKQRGAAARAQLMELVNDQLGLLAALAGTLFIWWGWPLGDPIAAMVVGTIIAVNAIVLFRENLSFLLGRAPGPDFLRRIEEAARSVDGVLAVRELRAEYVGPDVVHAGLHLVVARGVPIEEAYRIAETVRHRVHEQTDGHYCVIQVEPAPPDQSS
ncbi:MAG TPA: cation diffusion facilitator family transporter [Xanthobacteraceae bacterium]|nr:cation diffusion facilitator family transporter [Xanthobacteraceae bacterium]